VADYGNHRIIVFQGDAVPVAPALQERGRPLLAGHDGAAQLRVFHDAAIAARADEAAKRAAAELARASDPRRFGRVVGDDAFWCAALAVVAAQVAPLKSVL
jgi:hypothetical protein